MADINDVITALSGLPGIGGQPVLQMDPLAQALQGRQGVAPVNDAGPIAGALETVINHGADLPNGFRLTSMGEHFPNDYNLVGPNGQAEAYLTKQDAGHYNVETPMGHTMDVPDLQTAIDKGHEAYQGNMTGFNSPKWMEDESYEPTLTATHYISKNISKPGTPQLKSIISGLLGKEK